MVLERRHIPLEGASNFRDFGGYPTTDGRTIKWRRLFRSDRLSGLTVADYDALAMHRIGTVFDLRRDAEAAAQPTAWLGERPPKVVRAPLFGDTEAPSTLQRLSLEHPGGPLPEQSRAAMVEMYLQLVTAPEPLRAYGRIFAHLADGDGEPVLLHCAGGKDRTGVVCALILTALGVSRADVIEDFLLTKRYYDADANRSNRVAQVIASAGWDTWSDAALEPIFGLDKAYIEAALNAVAARGGVSAFLCEQVGVSMSQLRRLQDQWLSEPSG